MFNENDILYMQKALNLASQGQYTARPNPMVGCVIVQNNEIVGEGCHWQRGSSHAEINALQEAKEKAKGATCYVTLEPCAHWGRTGPCIEALIASGLKRVAIATSDPNPLVNGKGVKALQQAGILVEEGLCQREATLLNRGFFSRMNRERPYVRAKVAMSLDGRIALKSGLSQWITGIEARNDGHFERARSGAILTGSQTVLKDNCRLTFRGELKLPSQIVFEQPHRLLIDSARKCPLDAAIFNKPGKAVLFATKSETQNNNMVILPQRKDKVDLNALLAWCNENEINDLLVEAGGTLVGAFMQEQLLDELIVYIAPLFLGHEGKPMAHLPDISKLNEIEGQFQKIEALGKDLKLTIPLSEFAREFYDA